jgi:HD-GYP domain-containing protein (c-di-GMP phosphodiesterase class II)
VKAKAKNWSRHWSALQDSVLSLLKTKGLHEHLELVLDKAMSLVACDAGSIYLFQAPNELVFYVMRNKTLRLPQTAPFSMPIDSPGIAAHVFRKGQALRIKDVYQIAKTEPYVFSTQVDLKLHYRSKSMLCLPLKNREGKIIGVLQLINRKGKSSEKWPSSEKKIAKMPAFSKADEEMMEAFAIIASTGIENSQLYQEIEDLLKSFARASVQAIESRDLATRGHSERVTILTLTMARKIHESHLPAFKDIRFSETEFEELRLATLLHDFGKIAVPETILSKEEKLTQAQRLAVDLRLERFKISALKNLISTSLKAGVTSLTEIEFQMKKAEADFDKLGASIRTLSKPTILDEDKGKQLEELTHKSFVNNEGQAQSLLQEDEIKALQILRGSLSNEEKEWMQAHVTYSYKYLKEIPWIEKWKNIPEIAYGHHELLDGSGYPRKLTAKDIPIKVRAMTICDIFDALVANDRSYKAAVPVARALDILRDEAKRGKLDQDLLNLFIEEKVFETPDFLELLNGMPAYKKKAA